MRLGLVGRILIAGAVVVAFFLVEFALFLGTISHLRSAAAGQRRAEESVLAASRIERLLLDLETGQRGYVITGDPRFLQPWRTARRELPAAEADLRDLVGVATARRITAAVDEYLQVWAAPIVATARTDRAAARAVIATGAGRRRVEAITAQIGRLSGEQSALAEKKRRAVDDDERHGVEIGVVGVVGTLLLFGAIVGYFLRFAVAPLNRLAAATSRIAAGELATRVPPGGAGEVGHLAESFNTMADSLQRSQDELQQLVTVNRTVLDSTVDGICLTDLEGNILLVNRPLIEFVLDLNLPEDGTVPERLLSVADRFTDPDAYRAAITRIAAGPEGPTFDEFEFADTHRCFQGFTAPVRDAEGALVGRVWTLREVTREREADRAKDEFVATVSHELRTPLTSIVGFLEMLLDEDVGPLTDDQRQYLEIVQRSSQRLMRQVGDLLFMARLDEAGLTLAREPVSLDEVAEECVEAHAALARNRSIELELDAGGVPSVSGDRERLVQVTTNLLSNALKFTPQGGRVEVRTFVEDGSAVLEVEDTGIGIPEDERDRLFQRFFRSSSATRQAVQGTGLGLAISKAIVEAHGGSIAAEPAAEKGTRFRVELPL
ncbi:MAG TPA: ATP-binding protein [Gaiellaceae bacterium]|nr:ATP-binding protein [Gaiellaceae bacterium]